MANTVFVGRDLMWRRIRETCLARSELVAGGLRAWERWMRRHLLMATPGGSAGTWASWGWGMLPLPTSSPTWVVSPEQLSPWFHPPFGDVGQGVPIFGEGLDVEEAIVFDGPRAKVPRQLQDVVHRVQSSGWRGTASDR